MTILSLSPNSVCSSLPNSKFNDSDLKLISQAIQFTNHFKELVRSTNNYNFGELLLSNRFLFKKHFQILGSLSLENVQKPDVDHFSKSDSKALHASIDIAPEKLDKRIPKSDGTGFSGSLFESTNRYSDCTKKLAMLARDLLGSMKQQSNIVHEKMFAFCEEIVELLSRHQLFIHEFIHSDLIPVSQNQLNLIPNGMTRENAKIWSDFFMNILQNRTAIQIDNSDLEFKNEILKNFQILIGRECGRSMLLSLSMSPVPIAFIKGRSCRCIFYSDHSGKYDSIIVEFNFSKLSKVSTEFNSKNYDLPCFHYISLFHEMVHIYNRLSNFIVYDPPSFELFSSGEEEIAITGEYGVLSLPYSENKCRAAFGLGNRSSHCSADGVSPERYVFGCIDLNLTGEIEKELEKFPFRQNDLEYCIFWCMEDPNRFEMAKILISYGISRGFFQGSVDSNFISLKERRITPKTKLFRT
jgi:hypothetical protein